MTSVPLLSLQEGVLARGREKATMSPSPFGPGARKVFSGTFTALSKTQRGALFSLSPSPKRIDFNSTESKKAMKVIRDLFLPIVMRRVLRARKKKRWPGEHATRSYTTDSIVQALRLSNAIISDWPEEMLRMLAQEAELCYLEPGEIIVYMGEWYVSSGIVVLLHGGLTETSSDVLTFPPIKKQMKERHYSAQALFCEQAVLCRDVSLSRVTARSYADVAILPARWTWDVITSYVLQSSAESVLDCLRMRIVPLCEKIMRDTYYPTSLVLRRSWMWSFLSASDRVQLARHMECKVFCIGDTLFGEERPCPYLFIIRRGTVKAFVKRELFFEFEAGASFGEISMIFDEPSTCHAVAATMCEVYCLHRKRFLKLFRKKPHLLDILVNAALRRRVQWLEEGISRDIMGIAALIGQVPCLSQTTETVRVSLARKAKVHVLPPRQKLFRKGMLCDSLFLIGRGTLIVEDGQHPHALRTKTEFVGELCLHPHIWPTDVVTCTSVDGWSLGADIILEALASIRAGAQAVDICRHGIELYRAQHGVDMFVTESLSPVPPSLPLRASNGVIPRLKRASSIIQCEKSNSVEAPELSPLKGEMIPSNFNWVKYAMEEKTVPPAPGAVVLERSETRSELEKKIELELSRRAGMLLSISKKDSVGAVDSDFSSESDDIQQMLVEQAFLTPTARLAAFLRQINRSKVTMIFDDSTDTVNDMLCEKAVANVLATPQYVSPPSVLYTLDGITTLSEGQPVHTPVSTPLISPRTGFDLAASTHRRSQTPELFIFSQWKPPTFRSSPDAVSPLPISRPQSVMSLLTRQLRPYSGINPRVVSSRVASAGCNHSLTQNVSFYSRTRIPTTLPSSHMSECAGLEITGNVNNWTKPHSVDLSQQAKISAAMFQSALDRYVKLDDQNYFQGVVRVRLPPQEEEHWSEEVSDNSTKSDGLILLLMHVRCCEGLELSDVMRSPIVKVSSLSRVLIRTPIVEDRHKPVWPIETASFISFVLRNTEVCFTVCDADDEEQVAYSATMPTTELRENGGVGMRSLRLHVVNESLATKQSDSKARVDVCMLAVTASKQGCLHPCLTNLSDDDKLSDDFYVVYLQVLGVQDLRHRIEASVSVSVETDSISKEILRTPMATPKARNLLWPGQSSFCAIKSDGVVSFDLYHRDVLIASYDTSVDSFIVGGVGIHAFPLSKAQGNASDIYGNLLISILGLSTPFCGEDPIVAREKVLFLHVQSFTMNPKFKEEFNPDPFIIVRGQDGEVIMRTPLSPGTYNATWTEEEASCFIMCPLLTGSSASYQLEVYDNSDKNKIGVAELIVTENGTRRNRMSFAINSQGTLRISAYTFHVQRVLNSEESTCLTNGLLSSVRRNDDLLLLIHISGCDNLQGTGFDDFQIDPLVTVRVGRRRMVVAPMVAGGTSPRWSYSKAAFVMLLTPDSPNHLILEVWDTNIELSDVLGVVHIPITVLCQTGTHQFALQSHIDQKFGRRRDLGTITVRSRFGHMNSGILKNDLDSSFFQEGDSVIDSCDTVPHDVQSNTLRLPVTQVRIHISSCCIVGCAMPIKSVKVSLSCLQNVVLEVQKNCVTLTSAFWSVEEAQTILDLRRLFGNSVRLTVSISSETSDGPFTDLGSAFVSFSTLVSSTTDAIIVRSFPLLNSFSDPCEIPPEGMEEDNTSGVSFGVPSITISLLGVDHEDSADMIEN